MSPSFKLMAKAVGVTTEELDKMMKQGKLFAKDVLPEFGKNLREFAAPGLDKALKSNRVAMNKFMNEVKFAADEFFKGGFGEGLTDLFNSLNVLMKENSTLWKSLGKLVGSVLKIITVAIKALTPILSAFGSVLNGLTSSFGDLSGVFLPLFTALAFSLIPTSIKELSTMGKVLGGINKKLKVMRILSLGLKGLIALGGLAIAEDVSAFLSGEDKKTITGKLVKSSKEKAEFLSGSPTPISAITTLFGDYLSEKFGLPTIGGSKLDTNLWYPQWQKDLDEKLKSLFFPSNAAATQANMAQPITINTQINMDGELLAQNVTKTNAFASAVDRQSNSSFTQGV